MPQNVSRKNQKRLRLLNLKKNSKHFQISLLQVIKYLNIQTQTFFNGTQLFFVDFRLILNVMEVKIALNRTFVASNFLCLFNFFLSQVPLTISHNFRNIQPQYPFKSHHKHKTPGYLPNSIYLLIPIH